LASLTFSLLPGVYPAGSNTNLKTSVWNQGWTMYPAE